MIMADGAPLAARTASLWQRCSRNYIVATTMYLGRRGPWRAGAGGGGLGRRGPRPTGRGRGQPRD
jgi:hypothetical protein